MKYTFSPRMFVNALVRYNRDKGQVDSHIRFRLLSSPTGGLFFVYNEQQDVQNKSTDRVVAFKYTYELRGPFLAPSPSRLGVGALARLPVAEGTSATRHLLPVSERALLPVSQYPQTDRGFW